MSEKSVGFKGKPPDKQDVSDGGVDVTKEKSGSNLNENASSRTRIEKVESPKIYEKSKTLDKKIDIKPQMKINGVKNGVSKPSSRREDVGSGRFSTSANRSSSRGKTEFRSSTLTVASTQSKQDIKKSVEPSKSFNDESRLSKYIRRVSRDSDKERRLSSAKQLKDYLKTQEGIKAASKVADDILSSLQHVYFERASRELKQDVAICIGLVGGIMGHDGHRYFQWLFGQINNVIDDDNNKAKLLYMDSLLETLKYEEKKQVAASLMPMVMANVQTLLENADTPEVLMAVVNIILHISKHYSHVFTSHFRDTVDILVGWHIDTTQKDSLTTFTSKALIEMNPYWVVDFNFSITLLGQFLEDMEAYAEDLTYSFSGQAYPDEELPLPEECIIKITALLKVFTTVIRSLGDSFSGTKGTDMTTDEVIEILDRIVKSVDTTAKHYFSEYLLISAHKCIKLIMGQLGSDSVHCMESILPFILIQTCTVKMVSNQYITSLLSLTQKVIEYFGTSLPVSFVSQLLAPSTMLQHTRFSHNEVIIQQTVSIYHELMALKSVPLLEEAYKFVVGDLQRAYNILLHETDTEKEICVIPANPFYQEDYPLKQAEAVCIFNLCALAEICNTKTNLIAMWALSPSLFNLISHHFNPVENAISEMFPAVHYAMLNTLYSHCTRHGHFISSSHLTQSNLQEGSVMANATTSGIFSHIIQLLSTLLADPSVSFDSRRLCLKWVSDIVSSLQTSSYLFTGDDFVNLIRNLIQLGHLQDSNTALTVCQNLHNIFKIVNNLSLPVIQSVLKLCVYKLTDSCPQVREDFFSLMKILPADITIRSNNLLHLCDDNDQSISIQEGAEGVTAAWLAKRNVINKIPTMSFHSHSFKQVMAYLLQKSPPNQTGSWSWLEAMFYSCQHENKDIKSDDPFKISDFVDSNEAMLWFWATWETAQYCVLNRLRTPLGKAQDTFTSIETVLKTLAIESQHQEDDDKRSRTEETKGNGEHYRIQLILQFMEQLEKLLYNAYEGCAVAMPMPPKAVRTFFRINKGTCLEWLSRIRSHIIKIALHTGFTGVAVRQAHELLRDMKENGNTQSTEFEQTVLYLVKGLLDLKQPDALMGVYSWCKDVMGKKLLWIKALVEKAAGRYENAGKELKSSVKALLNTDQDDVDTDGKPDIVIPQKIKGILSKHNTTPVQQETHLPIIRLNFIVNQVVECYQSLGDWKSVMEWQEAVMEYRQDTSFITLQTAFNTDIDINYVRALSEFDLNNISGVKENMELVPGGSLNNVTKQELQVGEIWGTSQKLDLVYQHYVKVAAAIIDQKQIKPEFVKSLLQSEKIIEDLLRVSSFEWPLLSSQKILTELYTIFCLRRQLEDKTRKPILLPISSDFILDKDEHDVSTFLQVQRFVNIQQHLPGLEKKSNLIGQQLKLQLGISNLARKQENYILAEKLLLQQINLLSDGGSENGRQLKQDAILPALTRLRGSNSSINQIDVLRVERTAAKLLQSTGQLKDGIDIISNSIVGHVCSDLQKDVKDKSLLLQCNELSARSLLTIVKWLQIDHKNLSSLTSQLRIEGDSSVLSHNIQMLLEVETRGSRKKLGIVLEDADHDLKIGDNPILSHSDRVIGQILHLSTMECPTLSKSWFTLAGWCYKWGRKSVDNASHGSVELLTDEKAEILFLLPKGTSNEETGKVLSVLSQIHTSFSSEEDISEDQNECDEGAETTRKQLLSCCLSLQIASEDCIDKLLTVWKRVVHRVYHYYQLSAKAYFTYLQLNGGEKTQSDEDGNVIGTLRLLRLLVKHAWELRNVLEPGLASTPTAPWKGIIPQLFSRLSHPELYVRQSVSDLLCRVAHDAPHLIVYPAVVGSSSFNKSDSKDSGREGLLSNYLTEQLDDNSDDCNSQEDEDIEDPSSKMLQGCLMSIVEILSYNNPKMISEVKQLVQELRRITLLWDELWLGTLNQQHQDVTRKLQQLESEVKKVNTNSALTKDEKLAIIREKHKTIMKPTLYALEKLQEITSQPPETPQEEWFKDTYGKLIDAAIVKLRNPTNPSHPNNSWQLFKQLHASLQQKAQKRSSLILRMEKISPNLQAMKGTVIAMPGLGMSGKMVSVESVSNTVQILPTKTKPKKLVLLGSDGKKYPYLFKGLEDLHLDERIMQFLSIVNNMFVSASSGEQQLYRARHYSVTPLGPRSGLIQWVDGSTPLFSLYKRWQQRDALAQSMKNQTTGSTNSTTTPSILRPSEIFYNKLTPALRDKGITNLESRKEWPLSTLRSVLQELIEETPSDLLARELWCCSTGASEWWQITQSYARSTAVMSMIGYIIGLGDRHLDNVLVDLATGEVVHIDYNVCFEKGKGLRVPEKVPFRMTQNIETAMGVTGIEGTFRIASEHVIKTMRKGRETLLTLLEAFVYDPLVDWTTGNEAGYTGAFYGGGTAVPNTGEIRQSKRDMEREITISMFSIRMAEMKSSWTKNRDDVSKALPKLKEQIQNWLGIADSYYTQLNNVHNMRDLKSLIADCLTDPDHQLYTLKERYEDYAVVKTTRDSVQEVIQEKINEFSHWQKLHKHVIERIQGSSFQKMCAEFATNLNIGPPSFAAATEFLQGAGQGQIVQQCEQLEAEMSSHLTVQRSNLHHAIDVLHTYAAIVSQFGTTFADQNRTYHYLCFLQEVVCDFTSERCHTIVNQFHELYGNQNVSPMKAQLILNTEAKLQGIIADLNGRLIKLLERRNQDPAELPLLEHQIKENDKAIQIFVQENGVCGVTSLTAWIISALCSLNKRYSQMEAAAAGAGDRLMDLTSRDGDWFLDELCSMSSNVMHFIETLMANTLVQELVHFSSLHRALMATHNVYIALQELNVNFRSIILPEALKAIQAQEPTVCLALEEIEKLFSDMTHPLDTIVSQLEVLHRNAIMGIENDNLEMMTVVKRMQIQYQDLLQGRDSSELSPGQMLLMGFDGLFTRLEDEFTDLMEAIDGLQVPDVWRKVDAVREGKSMQLSSFTSNTRGYLSSLFFIKRLQTMQMFFHMCTQFAANLQGMEGGNCYDDDQLARPVKRFIAEYVRKQVIGFPSQILGYMLCVFVDALGVDVTAEIETKDIGAESKVPLEDLRKKAVDVCLRNGQFQHMHFTQASTLSSSLDSAWRRHDLARRLDSNMELMKSSLHRAQLQLARLQWLHEDVFVQSGRHLNQMGMQNRSTIMSEMRKSMQSLLSQESGLGICQTHYTQLESSIIQRLKWAAGANPSLNLVLQQFEECSVYRKHVFEEEMKCSTEVVSLCQGILHLEALRTRTPEAVASDSNFLTLINRCIESCVITESTHSTVTDLEILLMNTKPPGDNRISQSWLETCTIDIASEIDKINQEKAELKKEMDISRDATKTEVTTIKNILTNHHKLMSEIRTVLKSMAKQEELGLEEGYSTTTVVKDYLNTYKNFSENFTTALKIVTTEDITKDGMAEADDMVDSLIGQITLIYDDLVNLAPPLLPQGDGLDQSEIQNFTAVTLKRPSTKDILSPVRKSSNPRDSTPPGSPHPGLLAKISGSSTKRTDKVTRDPRTGKAIQERNSYAVSVWRRVKMKLDGRDPDPNKRFTVAEQVDFIIKDATNLDNLAVLYEGWTPWV
ncbi:serine/threonine-protein kinase SMG1-like isoform X1 [Mytilus californianus]|uniref:serine/threonine-protein kinase SMG1-like isoform X1 n=2 Tax=Mytilus californianus TaxID=6549 RepID=UPI0022474892|nr:serine/threonine-protein kinase SMG1-like isoform X1 [Mytilus californianus]